MRKWLIVLMAAVAIGTTGILGWLYMRQDRKGPEITIAESKKKQLHCGYDNGRSSGRGKSC